MKRMWNLLVLMSALAADASTVPKFSIEPSCFSEGTELTLQCHASITGQTTEFNLDSFTKGTCIPGIICSTGVIGYRDLKQEDKITSMVIISYNATRDNGNWTCISAGTPSPVYILRAVQCGNGDSTGCNVPLIIGVFFIVSLIVLVITFFVVLLMNWMCPSIGKVGLILLVIVVDVLFEIMLLWGAEYGSDFKLFKSDRECDRILIGCVCHIVVTVLIEIVKVIVLYRHMKELESRIFGQCLSRACVPIEETRHNNDTERTRTEDVIILKHFTLPEGYSVDTWATEKTSSINDTSKYRPSDRGSLCIKAATKKDNGIYQSILMSNDGEQRINAVLHLTEQESVSLVIHPLIWRRLGSKNLKKMSKLKDLRHKLSTNKIDDIEMKKEDKSSVSVKSVRWKHNGRGIPSNYNNDEKEVPPLEVIMRDPIDEYHCTVQFSDKKSQVYIFIVKFTGGRSGNKEDVIGVPTIMNTKSEDITADLPPIRHTGTTAPANQNHETSPFQGSDLHSVTARSAQSTTEDNT